MLFLPECFHYLADERFPCAALPEPLSGPSLARYRELAAAHKLWLSLGGFQEAATPPPAPCPSVGASSGGGGAVTATARARGHNTHVVVRSDGTLAAAYRKAHLFDLDLPGLVLRESERTAAGSRLVVADTPAGRLALSVCYDLRFPQLYAALAGAGAAQVLAVPAAFTAPTGAAHWELLLRARAVETQCYVVAAAQVGTHNPKRTSWGHAMVVDPWGAVVAQVSGGAAPALAIAEIDLDYVAEVRRRMPVAAHARAALYTSPVVVGEASLAPEEAGEG
jgi:predicted amidohydrolase